MIDPRSPNYASTPVSPDRPVMPYAPAPVARLDHDLHPIVSVVTPFFNTGEVFHQTAAALLGYDARNPSRRSASGQSLQNFEWIIVNDASTDESSLRILADYRILSTVDSRIRIIDHRQNHGLPAARNTGFRAARGGAPFVFFLDSDDLIEPTTLEKSALHLACNPEFAFVKGYSVGFAAQEYLWTRGFHDRTAMLDENLVTATTMVRASVLHSAGGFDETIRGGMEDWEFWLRCAAEGHWGETIPEYLDWYRRRDHQHAAWENISQSSRRNRFLRRIQAAHAHIFNGEFPSPERAWHMPFAPIAPPLDPAGFSKPLRKTRPRLLLIAPWLRMGGADRFNLDLVHFLVHHANWEVTVATTLSGHPWLPEFAALTPDVFCLDHLARQPHIPRLLDYLITSRRPDAVMVTNAQLGYSLLPWLRHRHPEPAFVDFNHMEEPNWHGGGHPRTGAGYQSQLDLSIVVSHHLKRWMSSDPRSADADRIEVCHINADTRLFRPDPEARAEWRAELKIDDSTPVLLYAARICPQKQPIVFARTVQLLAEADRQFVAIVAGDGELQTHLESAIAAMGIAPRIRMLGPVPADRMPGLMAAADIFFLPSQWEGIAMSIYEAMAAGLCVVGADVGGQAELVTPDTGVLLPFPERDPELEARAYADTIAILFDQPDRIASLGAAARARIAKHFELASMGERMLAYFRRAERLRRHHPREAVSEPFARELALQGVEMMRIQALAEELWPYRQRCMDMDHAAAASADEARKDAEAAAVLAHLESSSPWRAIQAIKSTPPYKIIARARFGPDWATVDPKEPARARLERIRGSRAFRIAEALRKLRG
ncbi:MAG TPA: glycosyltransferase [Phycisphaerales bacterium]|nr:glycosyltransferase [Phycisphaerales bacterium]